MLTALLAAPLLVTALGAQDTTRVDTTRVDTTRVEAGQIPTSHVVVRGETLWSIAQMYYGDPLLWPEIYRLNTAVVEDPHWIYPGEELLLAPATTLAQAPTDTASTVPQGAAADTVHADTVHAAGDTIAAVADTTAVDTTPEPPPPPPPPGVAETYQTIFDRSRTRSAEVRDILRAHTNTAYHPVRRGEYYSAGWLTEQENLPWANVRGNTAQPAIHRLSEHTSAGEFEEIAIEPPRSASYHVGDSLLLARLDREEVGWGRVVVPVGVARVTSVQGKQVLAQVVMQFGRINAGRVALPLEPYKDPGVVRPTPVAQGLEGRVVDARDIHALVGVQQIYFIDKGRAEGVTPGDVFEIYRPAAGEPRPASEEVRVQLLIVHTREHSASGLVIGVANPDVVPGMPVRLVKKMPS